MKENSLHEVAIEASPKHHKKKTKAHKHINILALNELDKSGNEAKNGD